MGKELDFQNEDYRKQIIDEILGDENERRKKDHLKRFEVMSDRQHDFVVAKLKSEFGEKALEEMRLITSINLTKRIVNEKASIYTEEPERVFNNMSKKDEQLAIDMFEAVKLNVKMKKANKVYKLHAQGAIMVTPNPAKKIVDVRILRPHQYDVVPVPDAPEEAAAYIISQFDKEKLIQTIDQLDQKIADREDYKRTLMRFVWWTPEFNFKTNGHGELIITDPQDGEEPLEIPGMTPNLIKRLPFIDLAGEKEFEFWIRLGQNVVDFNIDYSATWSDMMTISKMQGYAQAVLTGDIEQLPNNIKMGPLHVLMLPATSTSEVATKFEFVNPNPDLEGSLNAQERLLNNFLTSEGLDVDIVTSSPTGGQRFSSALERMLAQIDKFKATKDDFDLFKDAEVQTFELLRDWNNALQEFDFLKEDFKKGKLPENAYIEVNYKKPETVQTQSEKEDSVIKRLEKNLITKIEAIMELRGIEEKEAKKVLEELNLEKEENMKRFASMVNNQTPPDGEDDGEQDPEKDVQPEDDVRDGNSE